MPVSRHSLRIQHRSEHLLSRLLAGSSIYVEILEEDLGSAGARSAILGVVLGLDVDGACHGSVRAVECGSFAVGAGDTVALGLRSLDDELQVSDAFRNAGKSELHSTRCESYAGIGRSLYTRERRNAGHDVATAVDDPVVEPHEEVAAADLALGAEHRAAFGSVSCSIPRENLSIGQASPRLAKALEHGLYRSLVAGAGAPAIATVTDVLTALDLRCGHALGGARHLFESD